MRTREAYPMGRNLLYTEQHRAEQERHEVIHGTIGEEGSEQGVPRNVRQRHKDDRLEHPDATGHVTDDAGDHGCGVGSEERHEAYVGFLGKKPPQHGPGKPQIDHGEADLRQADRGTRRPQGPPTNLERGLGEGRPRSVGKYGHEKKHAHSQ